MSNCAISNRDEAWPMCYVWSTAELLRIWVIRWHVGGMCSLTEQGQEWQALSNHVRCSFSDRWYVCSTLQELAVSNPLCLSITWSRCHNARRDLWIMTIKSTCLDSDTCTSYRLLWDVVNYPWYDIRKPMVVKEGVALWKCKNES